MHFTLFQINHGASKSIDEVMASVTKNKVCLKGVIGIPEVRTWSNIVVCRQTIFLLKSFEEFCKSFDIRLDSPET